MKRQGNDDPLLGMKRPRINEKVKEGIIGIDEFIIDDELQVRERMREDIVSRYMTVMANAPETMPPITLAKIRVEQSKKSLLHLVDGFHRAAAARKVERKWIKAKVIEADNLDDARWKACSANLTHGLPLRSVEVREGFRAFMRAEKNVAAEGKLLSYREISAAMNNVVGKGTLHKWMHIDFPTIAERMAEKDGNVERRKEKGMDVDVDELIRKINELEMRIEVLTDNPNVGKAYKALDMMYGEVKRRANDRYKELLKEEGSNEYDF